jgi:hypothetical protein
MRPRTLGVYGHSTGVRLTLAAVHGLVRRGALTPAVSDPASQTINDPALSASEAQANGLL